jgi:hypothetical protein
MTKLTSIESEPLFMQHERFRRVERMFRDGYKVDDIMRRERAPRHVIERIIAVLQS